MTARKALGILLGLALAAVACRSPSDSSSAGSSVTVEPTAEPQPWAWQADIWLRALGEVIPEQGGRAWRYFWDPHVEWDAVSIDREGRILRGDEAVTMMAVLIPRESQASRREAVFLDRDGAVLLNRFSWEEANMNWTTPYRTPAQLVNVMSPIGVNGAAKVVTGMSADSWRERSDSTAEPDAAEAFAAAWLDVRSGRAAPESLYSPQATITDSIAGVIASGTVEVATLVRREATIHWTTALVGGEGDDPADVVMEAIYPLRTGPGVIDSLVVVMVGDDGNQCPGPMAMVLDVADDLIEKSTRYWDLERARRCLEADELPDGWWSLQSLVFDDRYVPSEDLATRTGTVSVGDIEIDLYNSTDELEALIDWAMRRFEQASLEIPDVHSIRFSEFSEPCHDVNGRVEFGNDAAEILLCLCEHDLSGDGISYHSELDCKHIVLHELAHVWMRQQLDDATREAFLASVGLETWVDGDIIPWQRQGREVAAETIAWGLLDEPMTMYKIGAPEAETLTAGFALLTGLAPLQPAAG